MLIPLLALVAGCEGVLPVSVEEPGASVSAHAPPAEQGSAHEEAAPPFRLARGVGGTALSDPAPAPLLPATPLDRLPLPTYRGPDSHRAGKALRDGTVSSRSTGLPPPLA